MKLTDIQLELFDKLLEPYLKCSNCQSDTEMLIGSTIYQLTPKKEECQPFDVIMATCIYSGHTKLFNPEIVIQSIGK